MVGVEAVYMYKRSVEGDLLCRGVWEVNGGESGNKWSEFPRLRKAAGIDPSSHPSPTSVS